MFRRSRSARGLLALGALLSSTAALAQDQPPEPVARSVEERLREVEEANAALQHQVQKLEQKLETTAAAQSETPPSSTNGAPAPAPAEDPTSGEPFAWGDFTWLNGGSRQTHRILDTKYFTPQLDVDLNYTYSFNRPIDDTIVGSTATFRHNELELAFLGIGGDAHIGPARGRIFFQFGERAVGVPRNDVTSNRGQYDLLAAMRYLSEAYA
ncbi:MAG TPA: hypothetical protein VHB97_06080, partial [Polyangia bacterium]|nr:hypothetical protein [Polyangia bacterium]